MDDQKLDSRPDPRSELQPVSPSLKGAIRRVRIEEAERSGVLAELRGAEIARLEMLADALEPVFAQVPENIDIFDAGVMPGETPRLYIDMIGFVEMGQDKRVYRFIQNTRHGRIVVAQSEKIDAMISAINNYVARRIVEREQALAGDRTVEDAAQALARARGPEPAAPALQPRPLAAAQATAPATAAAQGRTAAPPAPRRFWSALVEGLVFLAELIGFIVLLVALFGALYFGWTLAEAWWVSYFGKAG